MASRAAAEAVLLLLTVACLLPLRLLSLALRPCLSSSAISPPRRALSSVAALLAVSALLITTIYAVPDAGTRPGVAGGAGADADALRTEIEALRLEVARLESMLEENTKALSSKSLILEEDNKLIEAMERDTEILMNAQEGSKNSQRKSYSAGNIKAMEDEVQQLQQESGKINSNTYTIESLAREAERKVEALSSEVKKIEDIIAEQWIQIRQIEQAFVLTKMRTSKIQERSRTSYKWPGKDTILKYVRNVDLNGSVLRGASYARSCFAHTCKQSNRLVQAINGCYHKISRFRKALRRQYIPDIDRPDVFFLGGSISRSCISLPYNQFKASMSSAQKFHNKVQVFVQGAMRSNSYTRGLANEPVTFFLAYLIVISPIWIAWFLYSRK